MCVLGGAFPNGKGRVFSLQFDWHRVPRVHRLSYRMIGLARLISWGTTVSHGFESFPEMGTA